MPSTNRSRSAAAVIDCETADRALARGVSVSPGRVRRWRVAGLLQQPDEVGSRPSGAPPGRLPRKYSVATLAQVDLAVDVLVRHARRGRSQRDLALILFAHRLPVGSDLVREAIESRLDGSRCMVEMVLRKAQEKFPAPEEPGLQLDNSFERAEALARMALAEHSSSIGDFRRNLRSSGAPAAGADLLQIATHFFQALGGGSTSGSADEDQMVSTNLMRALGMDGMLQPPAPDISPLLQGGPHEFVEAVRAVGRLALISLPHDLSDDELLDARDLAIVMAGALTAIPDPDLLGYLGGPILTKVWDPSDPNLVAITTTLFVHVQRRDGRLDPTPIVNAVRDRGWLMP